MKEFKIAVVGIGATGAVQAAALLKQNPEIVCIDPRPGLGEALKKKGITASGALDFQVQVRNFFARIQDLKDAPPDLIFIQDQDSLEFQVNQEGHHMSARCEGSRAAIFPGQVTCGQFNIKTFFCR